MEEKYVIKTKRFDNWIRSDLRFLPEGISISNEYKSIIIGYNELTSLNIDENLFLSLIYVKNNEEGKFFGDEVIECNEDIMKLISKKSKIKITKVKKINNGKLSDSVILFGKCRFEHNEEEVTFYLTHKKLILMIDGNQVVYNLDEIESMQRNGTTGVYFMYKNIKHELYYSKIDKLIMYIEQNKYNAANYGDNVDLTKLMSTKPKAKPNFLLFGILILIIIALVIFYVVNVM